MPDRISEQLNLLWQLLGGMALVVLTSIGGFAKIVWDRGNKFVLKETCTQCQAQWQGEFKTIHEEIGLVITLIKKEK